MDPQIDCILVAEPLQRIQNGLEVSLHQGGYRVVTDDGIDVFDKIEVEVPDIVLLSCDARANGSDSFAICRRLVEDGIAAAIVMTSAQPTKEMVLKSVRAGARGFVVTPSRGSQLWQKLEGIYRQTPQAESRAKFPIIRFGNRDLSRPQKIDIIMRDASSIRMMPHSVTKILQVTGQEETGADDIARAAGSDATVAAIILRRANSSYYGGQEPVSDLRAAVVRIGFRECRDQVISLSVSNLFPKIEKSFGFDRVWYWLHSLCCALLAESIGKRARFENYQDSFTAGLLHDLGKIVLDDFLTSVYGQVVRNAHTQGITITESEQSILERTHSQVGGTIAQKWKFSESICQAILRHHDHERILQSTEPNIVGAVYLADQMTKAMLVGNGGDFIVDEIPNSVWKTYGYDDMSLEAIISKFYDDLTEFYVFLQIKDRDMETALERNTDSGTCLHYDPEQSNTLLYSLFLVNQGFSPKPVSEIEDFDHLEEAPQLCLLRPGDLGEAMTIVGKIQSHPCGPWPTLCILDEGISESEVQAERRWLRVLTLPLDCFALMCMARELLPDVLQAKVIEKYQ